MTQWISVNEQLPAAAQSVLAVFNTGYKDIRRITLLVYIPEMTVKAEDLWDVESGDCTEYNEKDDCYYVEAGWYEESYESEIQWKLSCEVTHWMPLPEMPKEESQ